VVDSQGGISDYATNVTISIRTHLEAVMEVLTGYMDNSTIFQLRGRDYSSGLIVENSPFMIFRIRGLPNNGVVTSIQTGLNLTSTDLPYPLPEGTGSFIYKTNSFWAGNDSISFDMSIFGANSNFRSVVGTDTLLMLPILYPPEVRLISSAASIDDIKISAYFQVEIISHSEPYFDQLKSMDPIYAGCDLYMMHFAFEVSAFWELSMAALGRSYFNLQTDGCFFEIALNMQMEGFHDSSPVVAVGTLPQLRLLIFAGDPSDPTADSSHPFFNAVGTTPGNVDFAAVTICPYVTGQISCFPAGFFPSHNNLTGSGVAQFTVTYNGGTGNEGGGTLPTTALVFVWIGIGVIALGCYGCLFWRWWKNRRLQQRTRTNMAAGANASKYLHSL